MYCVYKTTYRGDKFPKYYIGSTSIEKINNGYVGSVQSKQYGELWREELKENIHLFDVEILSTHDTRKEALENELFIQKKLNVVKSKDYVNKAFAVPNGFFGMDVSGENNPMYGRNRKGFKASIDKELHKSSLNRYWASEKGKIHREKLNDIMKTNHPMKGRRHSEEAIKKMSEKQSGENNPMYGKKHSDEAKMKVSLANKGKKNPMKGKKMTPEQKKNMIGIKKTEEHKKKLRKKYIIDNKIIVDNAKQYCKDNNLSYSRFTGAARSDKPYKGMIVDYYKDNLENP